MLFQLCIKSQWKTDTPQNLSVVPRLFSGALIVRQTLRFQLFQLRPARNATYFKWIWTILTEAVLLISWPWRWHYVSCGLAHMPILSCQKWYIFPTHFNNFTFCFHVTFQILAPTIGFGHFFVLHRFHGRSSRPVAITRLYVLLCFAWNPNVFAMFSNGYC